MLKCDVQDQVHICLKVIGIGGAGTNAVNAMMHANQSSVEYIAASTS